MTGQRRAEQAGQALLDIDHAVHEAVEDHRADPSVRLLGWLSEIGDQPQLRLLSGGMVLAGLVRLDPRMASAGVRMLLAHELATAIKNAVKHRVDRRRPRSAHDKEDKVPHAGRQSGKEETSFPSGHSAGALAVASAFSAHYPESRPVALSLAGAVALAQIPRCAHYPTDVGAGLAIGAAADAAVGLAWKAVRGALSGKARRAP